MRVALVVVGGGGRWGTIGALMEGWIGEVVRW